MECRDFLSCQLFWNRWNRCIEPHRQHGGLYLSNLLISQFARLKHDYMHEVINRSQIIPQIRALNDEQNFINLRFCVEVIKESLFFGSLVLAMTR